MAGGYALFGILGVFLPMHTGFASPLFPAAGLAVAVTLHFGVRILSGVWIGSFIVNLAVAWQTDGSIARGIIVSTIMALGATLQAWVAHKLVTLGCRERWRRLESEKEIIVFLMVAAPLACLVSASIAIVTLYVAGIATAPTLFNTWFNWWLGDSLGVLFFAPLTLIFLLRRESPWKERQLTVAIPLFIAIALLITIFDMVAKWNQTQLKHEVAAYGAKVAQAIDHRLAAHTEVLSSLSRLIEITPHMSFQQFEHFISITLKENPDIFALSYNPLVQLSTRGTFERDMAKKTGKTDFIITERNSKNELIPAAERQLYVPVGYIAPLAANLPALGFDINSNAVRRAAITRALAINNMAVTEPIQLVQEKKKRRGVLILNPIHTQDDGTIASPSGKLNSFAVEVVKVDELVQLATRKFANKNMVFQLDDALADATQRTFFLSDNSRSRQPTRFAWKISLTVADREWVLTVYPHSDYLGINHSWVSWGTGMVGLLVSAIFQTLLLAMSGREAVIQRKVTEQTAVITHTNQQLDELNRNLNLQVAHAVAEIREKDQMLISQGRQAATGELIVNISHHWRQPLNAMAMLIANLEYSVHNNELTLDSFKEAAKKANMLLQRMSDTIRDFSTCFSPDKRAEPFSALDRVRSTVALVEAAYQSDKITITIQENQDFILYGLPNEYSQVLLNLMINAKEAIVGNGVEAGSIVIILGTQGDFGTVTVRDNGGGIADENRDRIFEPYFSTKNMGTGIGLYMSKMIIENHMYGRIEAQNCENGCEMTLSVPLHKT